MDNVDRIDNAKKLAKQVGETLRRLRNERGISLQELADMTDVSKLTLGNIERGEANPSLTVIWKIANGLTIPISALLTERQEVLISRKNQGNKVLSANEACTLEPMFDNYNYGSFEIHRAFLKPKSEYAPGAHQSGVIEYLTVMQGEIIVRIDNEEYYLNQFDSIKFNGGRSHAYLNPADTEAVLHFVMTYTNK